MAMFCVILSCNNGDFSGKIIELNAGNHQKGPEGEECYLLVSNMATLW